MSRSRTLFMTLLVVLFAAGLRGDGIPFGPDVDWETVSAGVGPHVEFATDARGGRAGGLRLSIAANGEGQGGAWKRTFPVSGGAWYRFSVWRRTEGIASARRSALAEVSWRDAACKVVRRGEETAQPEYPRDGATADGWTEVTDVYQAPAGAARAIVELQLRWTPTGTAHFCQASLTELDGPPVRRVKLAAVHFRPPGKTPQANREALAPLIEKAGRAGADLVCLPESLTYYGTGRSMAEVAEPIPGPSTRFFGELSRRHDLYVVAGLTERDGDVLYNTAALLGPKGKLIGKYRKVCIPREEIDEGITPGDAYPVYDTRFGKLGMMVCWDVHFPEVARRLSNRGAEVLAMPIWGGNPVLARARAIENQVFLVTSTYTAPDRDKMVSGVFDREGDLLVEASEWGDVVVTEVDLAARKYWPHLGDFKARIHRERPEE